MPLVLGTFASASRAKDKFWRAILLRDWMKTSTARGSAAQEYLIVVQLVEFTIRRLLEIQEFTPKTSPPKREAIWDSIPVRTWLLSRCKLYSTYLTDKTEFYGTYLTCHTGEVRQTSGSAVRARSTVCLRSTKFVCLCWKLK